MRKLSKLFELWLQVCKEALATIVQKPRNCDFSQSREEAAPCDAGAHLNDSMKAAFEQAEIMKRTNTSPNP